MRAEQIVLELAAGDLFYLFQERLDKLFELALKACFDIFVHRRQSAEIMGLLAVFCSHCSLEPVKQGHQALCFFDFRHFDSRIDHVNANCAFQCGVERILLEALSQVL